MKRYVRWILAVIVYYGGALAFFRWWKTRRAEGSRLIVLRYHKVNSGALTDPFHLSVSPRVFEKQMEYVKRNYSVIACAEIAPPPLCGGGVASSAAKGSLLAMTGDCHCEPPKEAKQSTTLAVTFDDGYLDNYTEALPILKKFKIPAAVFVSTGLIGKEKVFWWDELERLVHQSNKPHVELSWKEPDGLPQRAIFDMASPVAKVAALVELEAVCNRVTDAEQKNILTILKNQLNGETRRHPIVSNVAGAPRRPRGTAGPSGRPPLSQAASRPGDCRAGCPAYDNNGEDVRMTLSWEEAKELSDSGVTIGSHGANHVLLTKVSREKALEEIVESKRIIDKRLGGAVKHFAFPGGQIEDWMIEAVRSAGYEFAFSTVPGENSGNFDPLRICRRAIHEKISVNPRGKFSKAMFACAVEGVFETVASNKKQVTSRKRRAKDSV